MRSAAYDDCVPESKTEKKERTAPAPDDPRKPDEISEITKPSWKYVLRKTAREFSADQATDLAAALTYYGVLAIFPALLAFVSIIGLFDSAQETTNSLLDLLAGLVPATTLDAIQEPIENLAASDAAGFTLVIGIVGALWSASGYVGAFSRAMNRIYEVQEGRPFWKLRPITLAVTVLAVAIAVMVALIITLSGPIAEEVGEALGLGETVLVVWNILRWPLLAFLAVLLVAVLYFLTPNVKQPRFRWISVGALLALVVWVVASAGFAFYAANFASYNETYGSIGGVIIFLLWVWISNLALLFGAELERGRELQAGLKAEETLQLPPRDTRQIDKQQKQHEKDLEIGRQLRRDATGNPDEDEEPAPPATPATKAERKRIKKANKSLNRTHALQAAEMIAPKKSR
jgi:membrane protein